MSLFEKHAEFLSSEEKDEWAATKKLFCVQSIELSDSQYGERWVLVVYPEGGDEMRNIGFPRNKARDRDFQLALDDPSLLPAHNSYIVKWSDKGKSGYRLDKLSGGGPCPCTAEPEDVDPFSPEFDALPIPDEVRP